MTVYNLKLRCLLLTSWGVVFSIKTIDDKLSFHLWRISPAVTACHFVNFKVLSQGSAAFTCECLWLWWMKMKTVHLHKQKTTQDWCAITEQRILLDHTQLFNLHMQNIVHPSRSCHWNGNSWEQIISPVCAALWLSSVFRSHSQAVTGWKWFPRGPQ